MIWTCLTRMHAVRLGLPCPSSAAFCTLRCSEALACMKSTCLRELLENILHRLKHHTCHAVVTGMNIIAILYVIFAGSPFGQGSNLSPFAPGGIPGIFAGAAVVYFSFVGFDTVATVAEEVSARRPKLC